jgi:glyoxylase I family protein
MRMSIIGLNHYNLRASRSLLEKLKEFYCGVLGLAQGQRPPLRSFGYWLYAGPECVLHLSEAPPDEGSPSPTATHPVTTFDHVAFTCTGLPEMEAHLKLNEVDFRTGTVPALGITQLFLQDPAGNGIELSFKEATNTP